MFALKTKLNGLDALIVKSYHEDFEEIGIPLYSFSSGMTSCCDAECHECPFQCDDVIFDENDEEITGCNDYATYMLEDTYLSIIERYKRQLKDS